MRTTTFCSSNFVLVKFKKLKNNNIIKKLEIHLNHLDPPLHVQQPMQQIRSGKLIRNPARYMLVRRDLSNRFGHFLHIFQ